ncbi:MAG: hypothetical protein KDB00_28715, partial [Planctomycetales bacterium]|nr:hypothetical protein [Planctomycetales bacterium]
PQRASMTLVVCCLVMVGVDVWLVGVGPSSVVATLCCVAVGGFVVKLWNHRLAFSPRAWSATAGLGVAVLTFASAQLLPTIATTRSLYVKASTVAADHPDTIVVFFGSTTHAAQMQFEPGRVVYYPNELRNEFAGFIAGVPEAIVVTGKKNIDSAKHAIASTHELDSFPLHNQLFLAKRIGPAPLSTPVSMASVKAERQR